MMNRIVAALAFLSAAVSTSQAQVTDAALSGQYRYVMFRYTQLARLPVQPAAGIGEIDFDGAGGLSSGEVDGSYVVARDGRVRLTTPVDGARMIEGGLSPEQGVLTGMSPASSAVFDWMIALESPRSPFDQGQYSGDYLGWAVLFSPFDPSASLISVFSFSSSDTTASFDSEGVGSIQFAEATGLGPFLFNAFTTQSGDFLAGRFSDQGVVGIFFGARRSAVPSPGRYWAQELKIDQGRVSAGSGLMYAAADRATFSQRWTGPRGAYAFRGVSEIAVDANGIGLLGETPIGTTNDSLVGGVVGTTVGSVFVAHLAPTAPQSGLVIAADVDAASFTQTAAVPGQLRSLFGSGFSDQQAGAVSIPLPTELAGASVLVNGAPAPLLYVGPNQINYQIPDDASGPAAVIVVQTPGGDSAPWATNIETSGPNFFTPDSSGAGVGIVTHADFSRVTEESPAAPGEVVVAFLTGLGRGTQVPEISVGGSASEVLFAGRIDGFVGLDQINFRVPYDAVSNPQTPVTIAGDNGWSDLITISVQQ